MKPFILQLKAIRACGQSLRYLENFDSLEEAWADCVDMPHWKVWLLVMTLPEAEMQELLENVWTWAKGFYETALDPDAVLDGEDQITNNPNSRYLMACGISDVITFTADKESAAWLRLEEFVNKYPCPRPPFPKWEDEKE